MDQKLKDYLDKCTTAKVDESLLDGLRSSMKEVVPEIVDSIKERERLASEFRRQAQILF